MTTRDFTYDMYGRLLDACTNAGYVPLTVREYVAGDDGDLPERFVILRHDVDRKPENARQMAYVEAERDVTSTYYVRTITKTFRPSLIERIEALGHEVGYHYEDVDRADGDVDAAHDSFERELWKLRQVSDVSTVCMHGNPLTPHDNRDLWGGERGFDAYDLLGEAYLSTDFEDVTYFSDTGRTWLDGALKIKDHTMGEGTKTVQVDTTPDLIDLLSAGRLDRVCLLTHPNRWAGSSPEWLLERTKDTGINAVKRGLTLTRRLT